MKHTLEEIRALAPESLTVHSLAIKRAANLNQQMDDYKSTIHHDMDAMHTAAQETAQTLGMEPYYLYRQKNIGVVLLVACVALTLFMEKLGAPESTVSKS